MFLWLNIFMEVIIYGAPANCEDDTVLYLVSTFCLDFTMTTVFFYFRKKEDFK